MLNAFRQSCIIMIILMSTNCERCVTILIIEEKNIPTCVFYE